MPAILTEPPDRSAYAFVLRRYDRQLQEHAIALICYTGQYDSRWIEIDGVTAHTVFVQTPEERDVGTKRGWLDATTAWNASLAREASVPLVEKALASLASPSVASAVAKTAGLPTAEVVVILDALAAEGKAVRRGTGAIVMWSAPAPTLPVEPEGAQAGA
jgi:hypothetical protein